MISRSEAIDYLIRHSIPVTEDNIDQQIKAGFDVIEPTLTKEDVIDHSFVESVQESVVQVFGNASRRTEALNKKYENLTYEVISRIERISREVEEAGVAIREAQVLERNMSGYAETLNIDFSDGSVINWNETTALISGGLVVGAINDRSKANKEFVKVDPISFRFAKATIRSVRGEHGATIQHITTDGIVLPHPASNADYKIVNSGQPFIISGVSDYRESHKLDILIDRESEDPFNQIELNLEKAEVINIFTSANGKTFTKEFEQTRYAKNTVFPIKESKARYIKIVFHKTGPTKESYGKYLYQTRVNSLNVLKATINEPAVVVTNSIAIAGNYSAMAIDTCDTYTDPNTDITYHVSINDGEWLEVRPSDKTKNQKILSPVALRVDRFNNNKIISLVEKNKINQNYIYSLDLPGEFLLSNTIKVFAEDITGTNKDWLEDHDYMSVNGLLYESKILELGSTRLELNGKWVTGTVTLQPGLYRIRTNARQYGNLFITKNAELINASTGEYLVTDANGNQRNVTDFLYPFNHKVLVESAFDFILHKELSPRRDYTIYSADTGYRIATPEAHNEVLVVYQLHSAFVSNVKIKATLVSKNKTSIPYIGKLILRLA